MKKTILTLIISLLTTYSLAETGKFNASLEQGLGQ